MGSYKYTFTVFTPTYNRKHTINRVFESLKNQTFKDFEWLIVDDGSTDNTDKLIEEFKINSDFKIRYYYKENGGKHTAINQGVEFAEGELFLIFDSDDACTDNALERLKYHWDNIPLVEKETFSGVSVLCKNTDGKIVGTTYPKNEMDISSIELRSRYKMTGEKWGFHRTDVLKKFPFPVIPNEKFMAESFIWNKIGMQYKIRHVNEALRIYTHSYDGLSVSLLKIRNNSPKGTRMYYLEFIKLPLSFKLKIRGIVNYIRFSFHAKERLIKTIKESEHIILTIMMLLPGFLLFLIDQRKIKKM
ncbi:MAG: glycosyltransferase family 2 protein [Candidatus Thiodiazotropha sp.]|jgi:glycosyltransferase involved in cell wall biosynthesis